VHKVGSCRGVVFVDESAKAISTRDAAGDLWVPKTRLRGEVGLLDEFHA
jgi:hypothetical protein